MSGGTGTYCGTGERPAFKKTTVKWTVVQEFKRRGTARNIEIARTLKLPPVTVGYILHQLRVQGCARRLKVGVYEFVKMPENLHNWDDGLEKIEDVVVVGDTMPQRILSILDSAPNGAISFRSLWLLSGLERNVTGAVLSELVKRGVVARVRRGVYKLQDRDKMPS